MILLLNIENINLINFNILLNILGLYLNFVLFLNIEFGEKRIKDY